MTDNNHPITPPPELVQQWWDGTHGAFYEFEAVATQAARWGADQELEACCSWADATGWCGAGDMLRTDRRSEPPSLKEAAREELRKISISPELGVSVQALDTIRRALESLPD